MIVIRRGDGSFDDRIFHVEPGEGEVGVENSRRAPRGSRWSLGACRW